MVFLRYTHFFYKNILDRFQEKIKNFCKRTFSPKVLIWKKCDIRTSYVTLEKLRTFPQKIHKFCYILKEKNVRQTELFSNMAAEAQPGMVILIFLHVKLSTIDMSENFPVREKYLFFNGRILFDENITWQNFCQQNNCQ